MRDTRNTRRRVQTEEERPTLRERISESAGTFKAIGKVLNILLLLFILFTIASLYTPWTGAFGAGLAEFVLDTVGGAVIIPLLFLLYASVCILLSRDSDCLYRPFLGSIFLFLIFALILGLNEITSSAPFRTFSIFKAGAFGILLSETIYSATGVLGTLIAGLLLIYFALLSFNIPFMPYLKLPLKYFSARRKNNRIAEPVRKHFRKNETEEIEVEEEEYTVDEPEETQEERDEYDEAAQERPAIEYEVPLLEEEENIDYNDPDSLPDLPDKAVTDVTEEGAIQEPEFNYEDSEEKRIKQGIFPPPIDLF